MPRSAGRPSCATAAVVGTDDRSRTREGHTLVAVEAREVGAVGKCIQRT